MKFMNNIFIIAVSFLASTSHALIVICGAEKDEVNVSDNFLEQAITIRDAIMHSFDIKETKEDKNMPLSNITAESLKFILQMNQLVFGENPDLAQKSESIRESKAKEDLVKNKNKLLPLLMNKTLIDIVGCLKDVHFLHIPEVQEVLIDYIVDSITSEMFIIHVFAKNSQYWQTFKTSLFSGLERLILDRIEERYTRLFKKPWVEKYTFLEEECDVFADNFDSLPALFTRDGSLVAHVADSNMVKIRNVSTGEVVHMLKGHTDFISSIAFNHDSTLLVTASDDNTAKIWHTYTGELAQTLEGHQGVVSSAAFNHDGTQVVTASVDDTAKIWDVATGKPVYTLEGHEQSLVKALFNYSGTQIITTSEDNTAKIWDAITGNLVHTLEGHERRVFNAMFSYDGTRVLTISDDHTVKVWDTLSGRILQTIASDRGFIPSAYFNRDGTQILTALEEDYKAKIWDIITGEVILSLEGHTDQLLGAVFSKDEQLILTVADDNSARVWDAKTGVLLQALDSFNAPVYFGDFSAQADQIVTTSSNDDDKYIIKTWQSDDVQNVNLEQALLNVLYSFSLDKNSLINIESNDYLLEIINFLSSDYIDLFRIKYNVDLQKIKEQFLAKNSKNVLGITHYYQRDVSEEPNRKKQKN